MKTRKNPPIEVIDVYKSFKNYVVLDGISFKMKEGEIYSLVGLNGIGKTTIIKIILGLLSQDKGEIRLFGKVNTNMESKQNVTYLPEKFMPSHLLKGHEFLSIACGYYGQHYNQPEAERLCQALGFDPQALSKRVSSYSKGMGQKLGLISVFLSKSKLLILDEPMTGLDPSARIFLKKMLKEYKEDGHSIFFTSHILADIEEICDRISVLHDGKLHYEGTVSKFIFSYKSKSLEESFLKAIEFTTDQKKSA